MRQLLIRPGAIGDCVLALPAMERLRESASYLEVWVSTKNMPLIRFADCVRAISSTGLDLFGLAGIEPPAPLLERLRSFDSIVSWYGANREEFREAVAAYGFPFRFLPFLPADPGVHAADFYLRQVGGGPEPAIPRLDCPHWDGGFAVIHPFSGSPRKNWPLERFRELESKLSGQLPVRWYAGPEEALENAVRIDDLYETACWLAGARVYIGNDSGISHLAAAAGAPVAAIFISTDPTVWAPRGERVHVVDGRDPEDVFQAVESLLAAG